LCGKSLLDLSAVQFWSATRMMLRHASAKGRGGPYVCNCLIDEGRPLVEIALKN
jgi:hypothetical protein